MSKSMTEREALELYNDMLDEVYGEIKICGLSYAASNALKKIDPIAYRCGFTDWMDAEEIEIE